MYAERSEDVLLFQVWSKQRLLSAELVIYCFVLNFDIVQWKGDTLELLETEFASRLDQKLFAYLTSCNSVPAFLSNVTIELFESQTFLG